MFNENFLSNESHDFFEKLLIKTILYELDWHLVLQYLLYLINNEDKHRDIKLIEFFQIILSFFNQNIEILNTKIYIPSLSSENDIDNMKFLIQKIIRHMKIELLKN